MREHNIIVTITAIALLSSCSDNGLAELQKGFLNPPEQSRPMVWWHWMDGNISKDGLKKDLDWMHSIGIRGFHQFDAALETPRIVDHRLIYMHEDWKDAFRYALGYADSLGMELGIASSPGWSHSGGPWVEPEDAMKKLVWREVRVQGGKHLKTSLPEPFPDFGNFQNAVTLSLIDPPANAPTLYKDIAVVAVRLPEDDADLSTLVKSVTTSGGDAQSADLFDDDYKTGVRLESVNGMSWVEYEFAEPVTVSCISVGENRVRGFASLSADDSPVCLLPISASAHTTMDFPPVMGTKFRLQIMDLPTIPGLLAFGFDISSKGVDLTEFKLYNRPRINAFEKKAGFIVDETMHKLPVIPSEGPFDAQAIDLSDKYSDGILSWDVPDGNWKIYRFGWSLTGKMNHPAPAEATGFEVDKLDKGAWKRYFTQYLDLYKEAAGGLDKIDYLLTDSYEAGPMTWTPAMFSEFRARRGYELLPWMPVLTGEIIGSQEESEKFLLDWRTTIGELITENFDSLTDIVRSYGLKGRYSESHEGGRVMLADGMDLKRTAAIPMSAIWTPSAANPDYSLRVQADMRESSSVAHICGQNIAAAESMTSTGEDGKAYSYYPGNLKPVADLAFYSGINRIVIHESAHQPRDDKFPGLGLNNTGQWFNRHETWADQAGVWTDYLSRSSFMLQAGRNVADLLLFYGGDSNVTEYTSTRTPSLPKGYNFDFVSPRILLDAIDYKGGKFISKRSSCEWAALVMDAEYIPEEAAAKIDSWKAQGAKIYTLSEFPAESLPKDLATEAEVNFVHRQTSDTDIYWVSVREPQNVTLSLRVSGKDVRLWDPETGEISPVSYRESDGRTVVELPMRKDDAKFIILSGKAVEGGVTLPERAISPIMSLDGQWNVAFQEKRGAPAAAVFDSLYSYTRSDVPGIRYFSGTASYDKSFSLGAIEGRIILDLGNVRNMAEVLVNGKKVRTLWKEPYIVDVTDFVRVGDNDLRVNVTNLWPNRLIGDAALPENERVTFCGYPFYKADDPLRDGGLLGPVKINQLR